MSSYTAQNIGADKYSRVGEGYRAANKLVVICAAVILVVLELFNRQLIEIFLGADGTATAVSTGRDYLIFMGFFFCFIGFKMAVDGLLRGAGDMKMFTVANIVNLFIRVFVAMVFAPRYGIHIGVGSRSHRLVRKLGDFLLSVPHRKMEKRYTKNNSVL